MHRSEGFLSNLEEPASPEIQRMLEELERKRGVWTEQPIHTAQSEGWPVSGLR
jgi:hypothetical protein